MHNSNISNEFDVDVNDDIRFTVHEFICDSYSDKKLLIKVIYNVLSDGGMLFVGDVKIYEDKYVCKIEIEFNNTDNILFIWTL